MFAVKFPCCLQCTGQPSGCCHTLCKYAGSGTRLIDIPESSSYGKEVPGLVGVLHLLLVGQSLHRKGQVRYLALVGHIFSEYGLVVLLEIASR